MRRERRIFGQLPHELAMPPASSGASGTRSGVGALGRLEPAVALALGDDEQPAVRRSRRRGARTAPPTPRP